MSAVKKKISEIFKSLLAGNRCVSNLFNSSAIQYQHKFNTSTVYSFAEPLASGTPKELQHVATLGTSKDQTCGFVRYFSYFTNYIIWLNSSNSSQCLEGTDSISQHQIYTNSVPKQQLSVELHENRTRTIHIRTSQRFHGAHRWCLPGEMNTFRLLYKDGTLRPLVREMRVDASPRPPAQSGITQIRQRTPKFVGAQGFRSDASRLFF